MNKKIFFLAGLFIFLLTSCSDIVVINPSCEFKNNPQAVNNDKPRFGWQIKSGKNNIMQYAYEMEVYEKTQGGKIYLWETGKVISDRSQFVVYAGKKLSPVKKYFWRVKVWVSKDKYTGWSTENCFRIAPDNAFLDASWIGAITREDAKLPRGRHFHGTELKDPDVKVLWNKVDTLAEKSICLRTQFTVKKEIKDAVAYVCGLGQYLMYINGRIVSDNEFSPAWSDYDKTVYYNAYDLTNLLKDGDNAVGFLLGNGFYNVYGKGRYTKLRISFGPPTLFFKLVITYSDGSREFVNSGTGKDWKYSLSPVTFNSIYGGEDYDARREQPGWNDINFDSGKWKKVVVQNPPKGVMTAQMSDPVKIEGYYKHVSVRKLKENQIAEASKCSKHKVDSTSFLLDMGQNLSGFPQITVEGKRGQSVILTPSETITDDSVANQRQTGRPHYYKYTLKGGSSETWHPHFSYYGFRYIQVEGAVLKGMENPLELPVIKDIKSCFVHNSAKNTASFYTSNTIFEKTHKIIQMAVRSNMQSIFTDCPHREKLGWLEQLHLNGPGLFYNIDLTSVMPKIMKDMADAQEENGMIPTTAPNYVIFKGKGLDVFEDSPEWSSSFIIVPFIYYEYYGDSSLISKYYDRMKAYVVYLSSKAKRNILDYGLGDWYDYGNYRAGFSKNTPVSLVATSYYYMDICYLKKAARMLGRNEDINMFDSLRNSVKKSFNDKFFNEETCNYGTGSQTSNSIPLYLNLADKKYEKRVVENLKKDIIAHGYRLTTGDIGNRYLFCTLADRGMNDVMYKMFNHYDVPGYGFQIKMGATTLTEQWDPRMGSSWNHFMMGQIDEWFFKTLAGICPDENNPGFKYIIIKPVPVGDLKSVSASYESLYGKISVAWKMNGDVFNLSVEIPANCSAEIVMPFSGKTVNIKSGKYIFKSNKIND